MTPNVPEDRGGIGHPPAMEDVYQRMAGLAGARSFDLLRSSGRRIHVLQTGQGPPVVHLHGTTTSALSHLMLARHSPGLRCSFVDRPGCGLSDDDPPTDDFRAWAVDFVIDVLDLLGVDAPVLVGASAGGSWATWTALAHPERVRGLVLLGAAPTLPGAAVPLPLRLMASAAIGPMLRLHKPNAREMARFLGVMGESDSLADHPDLLDALVIGARDAVAERANARELRALLTLRRVRPAMTTTSDELAGLRVPTTLILGEHDPVLSVAHAREVAELIPDCRLELLPAGHVPQLRHPERVASLIAELCATATDQGS